MNSDYTTKDVSGLTINERIKILIESILKTTPYEFSKSLDKKRPDWLYRIIKNEVSPSPKTLNLIYDRYPEYKVWIITGKPDSLEKKVDEVKRVGDQLKMMLSNKSKNREEGRLIENSNLVEAVQYIVPIKGQAGLKKAFFAPDEYIDLNFDKEVILVKPTERGVYHKIEVDGNSMPGVLDPGDWARCEDIPKAYWIEKDTFKINKVYCLFHRTKGILFKRISKIFLDSITLSSDNPDKIEYPDETFDLMEFSKILKVKVVEKRID